MHPGLCELLIDYPNVFAMLEVTSTPLFVPEVSPLGGFMSGIPHRLTPGGLSFIPRLCSLVLPPGVCRNVPLTVLPSGVSPFVHRCMCLTPGGLSCVTPHRLTPGGLSFIPRLCSLVLPPGVCRNVPLTVLPSGVSWVYALSCKLQLRIFITGKLF